MLEFNKPEQVKHIALLEALNKKGDFSYFGRKDESTEKFYNGDCAITTASSGSLADIRHYAKFNYGVGMMPYDADVKGAPQNAIIGGASLWVMQGKDNGTYKGVAEFLDFLGEAGKRRRVAPEDRLPADHQSRVRPDPRAGLLQQEPGRGYRDASDAEQAAVAVHQRPASGQHAADPHHRR